MIVLQHHERSESDWCTFEVFIENTETHETTEYCLIDVVSGANYDKALPLAIQLDVSKLIRIASEDLDVVQGAAQLSFGPRSIVRANHLRNVVKDAMANGNRSIHLQLCQKSASQTSPGTPVKQSTENYSVSSSNTAFSSSTGTMQTPKRNAERMSPSPPNEHGASTSTESRKIAKRESISPSRTSNKKTLEALESSSPPHVQHGDMHLHGSVPMDWILSSAGTKGKENQPSAEQGDNDDLYNVTPPNEPEDPNKDEEMTTDPIHTPEKDVGESLNMVETAEAALRQLEHQRDIPPARGTQAQDRSTALAFRAQSVPTSTSPGSVSNGRDEKMEGVEQTLAAVQTQSLGQSVQSSHNNDGEPVPVNKPQSLPKSAETPLASTVLADASNEQIQAMQGVVQTPAAVQIQLGDIPSSQCTLMVVSRS